MTQGYDAYQEAYEADIATCLDEMRVQPILFVGSGISQRYCGAPTWAHLLEIMAKVCPLAKDFAYYKQKIGNLIDIGSEFAELYREWAWGDGKQQYPEELFKGDQLADIFLKHKVASYFNGLATSNDAQGIRAGFAEEIEQLRNIKPHAVLTTNYDGFLEDIFPDYTPVIGQSILRANYTDIGEILKIHGCSSDPSSIVLTRRDYEDFQKKKKYLSAKILTFFAEHPLVFLGYSAEDPNVKSILADIDEILSADGDLIPNIYLVEWNENARKLTAPATEALLSVGENKTVRIKRIVADDFGWIYNAFSTNDVIEYVSPKILRALLARTYTLVRRDIPRRSIEVDFQTLEHAANEEGGLAKLYGITTLDDPGAFNALFPYSLTQVGQKLGYKGWHKAQELLELVSQTTGQNLKASDNKYHVAVKAGKTPVHKYSEATVDLLDAFRSGKDFAIEM